MTQTANITFRWADRNHIGEPMRHDIEWTEDDGKRSPCSQTPSKRLGHTFMPPCSQKRA